MYFDNIVECTHFEDVKPANLFLENHIVMETDVLNHTGTFEWKINDFSKHFRPLYSAQFKVDPGCSVLWTICVDFTEDYIYKDLNGYRCKGMAVRFRRSGDQHEINTNISISLGNTDGFLYSAFNGVKEGGVLLALPSKNYSVPDQTLKRGFQLCQNDVLLVRGAIRMRGCCVKSFILPL